jgi:hypothetical protein
VITRFACNYTDCTRVEAEIEFDATGKGVIRRADDSYIREALEDALVTPVECEVGEYRDGALASVPKVAEPGTPLHARAMAHSPALLEKGIRLVGIEGELIQV